MLLAHFKSSVSLIRSIFQIQYSTQQIFFLAKETTSIQQIRPNMRIIKTGYIAKAKSSSHPAESPSEKRSNWADLVCGRLIREQESAVVEEPVIRVSLCSASVLRCGKKMFILCSRRLTTIQLQISNSLMGPTAFIRSLPSMSPAMSGKTCRLLWIRKVRNHEPWYLHH